MQKEILEKLYEPFELKARPGQGGQTFRYVPSDDIVDRMNKVFMGDWSTEVIEKEIIEDQILIRVRVYAKDPMNSDAKVHWQEGYASQPIARFTQGFKSGQIIDIGNSFKSAMSKAIKTAVAKWGVGLYLEKGSVNEEDSAGSWGPPNIPTSVPEIKPVEQPKIIEQPPISGPVATPINIPSGIPDSPFNIPMTTFTTPIPPEVVPGPMPVFTDDNVVVTQPNTTASFNPPINSIPDKGAVEKLTDVQKAAIENIMSVHNKTFAELASAALQRTDNLPMAAELLSYQDAVKLIQHGNNLNTSSY
jgi:hypothetical protein